MQTKEQINAIIKVLPEIQKIELLDFSEYLISKRKKRTQKSILLSDFAGKLADSPNFNENTLQFQKRLRDEWQ